MSEQFVGEIRIFGCNFALQGWAQCNGQLVPIAGNTALFSIIGTYYGGNGETTFALPNLQGVAPMHFGQGAGLSERQVGETGGAETVTLLQTQIPAHTHNAMANVNPGTSSVATGNVWAASRIGRMPVRMYAPLDASAVAMSPQAAGAAGGSQSHNNMPPYLVLNFCIALEGIYPPRS